METITSAQYHQQHIESRKGYEVAYNTEGYDRIVKYSDRCWRLPKVLHSHESLP
ncbi:MAG: hypothetical protein HWQ38_22635 [Nostoc sp. NMS7]|uniref:hypothetical protein n=1 Tax=Nostoc sp. NMS7 TaxID=2815391 RepID=UPI0025E07871|nr:hypothetical protein [Nostoc sp. NMS7]MBN3949110.1 hypothetical protein [Nostoc sp. NMS7]